MCKKEAAEQIMNIAVFALNPLVVMLFWGGNLEACLDKYFRLLFISKKQKLNNLYHHNKTSLASSFPACEKGLLESGYFKLLFITNEQELKNKANYYNKTSLASSFPGWGRLGWGDTNASHTNPKAIHSVNPKIKLHQPSLLLLKDAGLEGMASSLHSFINNLFSLVSASESHPTLALPIQGGKACDALSGRFSGFIYLFARNYLPLRLLYHFSQSLSHLVTQSLNHLITSLQIPQRRLVC